MPHTSRPNALPMRAALLTTTTQRLHMMRPLPCDVRDWFAPYGTLAAWWASWWLILGVLCGVVALVVAWLVVWRDDE